MQLHALDDFLRCRVGVNFGQNRPKMVDKKAIFSTLGKAHGERESEPSALKKFCRESSLANDSYLY